MMDRIHKKRLSKIDYIFNHEKVDYINAKIIKVNIIKLLIKLHSYYKFKINLNGYS